MSATTNPRTFFDLTVGEQPLGRVVFELFNDLVPRTVENFRVLCTGEKGVSPISNVPLHYKGSPIHRIIDGFMIQGGDFTKRNGMGGESIYGSPFKDERLEGKGTEVDREGLLVMANRGPDTNGSQFFITLAPAQHLTGKHVVFGRVIHGLEHILTLGKLPTDSRDRPISPVAISHCGELELRRPAPSAAPVSRDTRESRSRSPDSRSPSRSRSRSRSPPPRKQRRYSTSSGSSSGEDEGARRKREKRERKERKKEKRRSRRKAEKGDGREPEDGEESEAALDARLEREEKERLEAERQIRARKAEEERQKVLDDGGVVFKGRGTMRYLDPESISQKKIPSNYNSRQPSTQPRRGMYMDRPPTSNLASRIGSRNGDPAAVAGEIADRWVKGVDARPIFQAENRSKGLDGYKTKGEEARRADYAGDGDKDRWSRGREWNARVGGRDRDERARSVSPPRKEIGGEPAEEEKGGLAARLAPRDRSVTPPVRPDSPPRGERDYGSDMELDD